MNIYLDGTLVQAEINDYNSLNKLWKDITKEIYNSQKFIQKVVIDNQEFYGDYDIHVLQNFKGISTIEVYTITQAEGIKETLNEVHAYSTKLLGATEQVAQTFYADMNEQGWELFDQYSKGVDWLYDTLTFLKESIVATSVFTQVLPVIDTTIVRLEHQVRSLQLSFEEEDFVLVGDIIQYEFQPIFEELHDELGEVSEA